MRPVPPDFLLLVEQVEPLLPVEPLVVPPLVQLLRPHWDPCPLFFTRYIGTYRVSVHVFLCCNRTHSFINAEVAYFPVPRLKVLFCLS